MFVGDSWPIGAVTSSEAALKLTTNINILLKRRWPNWEKGVEAVVGKDMEQWSPCRKDGALDLFYKPKKHFA